jgi:hypothetical protein
MKIGKILIAGTAATVFNVAVGMIVGRGVFGWVYKLEPTYVWKPTYGVLGVKFMIASLAVGIVFAFVYALIQKGIPGGNKLMKGIVFGLCVWAVGIFPGMVATYKFMTVATPAVIYWTILGLVKIPLEGMIVAAIYGE